MNRLFNIGMSFVAISAIVIAMQSIKSLDNTLNSLRAQSAAAQGVK